MNLSLRYLRNILECKLSTSLKLLPRLLSRKYLQDSSSTGFGQRYPDTFHLDNLNSLLRPWLTGTSRRHNSYTIPTLVPSKNPLRN
jgi:hypothetical protein